MKPEIEETQLEEVLETLPPPLSGGVDSRLISAPWTKRGAALRQSPWIAVLALLVTAAVALATPAGRVWAQGVIGLFIRADSDTRPQETLAVIPLDVTYNPDLAVVEAQAGFDVLVPEWIPAVVTFKGAAYAASSQSVLLSYYYSSTDRGAGLESLGITLTEQSLENTQVCDICSLVGSGAEIEDVQIGVAPGQYVVGVWKANDARQWGWENDPWLQRLRWQANSMAYELLYQGPPEDVTQADLVQMAESMK